MKPLILSFFLFTAVFSVKAQTASPDDYLGYPLGTRFTSHHQVVSYFKYIAEKHPQVKLQTYGKTYEGRPLMVAIISSASNMNRLEEIRQNNLALSNASQQNINLKNQPAILWLSYNVHGNEASSTETAMKMIYTLAQAKGGDIQRYLENTVVIIDPCLNPDGRDRYVQNFNSVSGIVPNANPSAREHQEPWPRGRANHYYFDLNRDWAWQTQIESQGRIALYHQWMPEVHVDFHEQSYNEPYYFAPAAEPVHESVNAWQREFQVTVGKNNAKHFDAEGWQYFTKERFDLLYPSYGDTYPLYNGAVGMTYEQGGIGAGLAVLTADGDTLTLKDRIAHHFTTGMSTLETVSNHAERLVSEFKGYFDKSVKSGSGVYKTFVIKGKELPRLKKLAELLTKNNIAFSYGGDRNLNGFDYESRKNKGFKLERNDMVINVRQPRAILTQVLFEPTTVVTDSATYDITAWALPYAYGLEAYALKEEVKGAYPTLSEPMNVATTVANPYAWVFTWNSVQDAKVLIALQQAKIKVRIANEAFSSGGKAYPSGTLLVYRKENETNVPQLATTIGAISTRFNQPVAAIASGYVDKGKDFGSSVYALLAKPKVAVLTGAETYSLAVGEVWNFFEQELQYPVSMITVQSLSNLDLSETNVLVLPDGNYPKNIHEKLSSWVEKGGKLILMEGAIDAFAGNKPFDIKLKESAEKEKVTPRPYSEKDKDDFNNAIPGAIYHVSLDKSHPLTLGLSRYYTLITEDKIYQPLTEGWNVGQLKTGAYVTGIAGKNVQKKLQDGLLYGVQPIGRGNVVYLGTNVLFRLFWESGKQIFLNGVFVVQ